MIFSSKGIDLRRLSRPAAFFSFAMLLALAALTSPAQENWITVGPAGGDARTFAAVPGQPSHLYLGTTAGWIYESNDGGSSWHHLARLGSSDDLILDHIVVDSQRPTTIYAAGWRASGSDGGLWISRDAGRSWAEVPGLRGQAIHALVQSPSDPRIFYAGTLEGVFRSTNGAETWEQVSPRGSREIHELASLAVDPVNPDVVYVGTWHLPWKTTDGGKTWRHIDRGLIVDSDIFSMVIDPDRPRTLYLSACSGIYKSVDAGLLFHKIQGIPSSARRTRVLAQDPENREIVYAGTTEGLYKTVNGGRTFHRMTGEDVIVNDVYVDPRDSNHVLLATDRSGVLASEDGARTFQSSNTGFSDRKVDALLVDNSDPKRLYAGVVNDKTYGGVFVSDDGGNTWRQTGGGLDGRDVFTLAQTKDGELLAGTNDGIFVLDPPSADVSARELSWEPRSAIANMVVKTVTETHYRTRVNVEKTEKAPIVQLDGSVTSLDVSGEVWVAATSYGVLTSHDKGATWQGGPVMDASDYISVSVHGDLVAAARPGGVVLSRDKGETWLPMSLPTMLTRIHRIAFSPDGTLWLGAREGVYFTRDLGKSWLWIERLPFRDVDDLSYDAPLKRILVSSRSSDQIFAIDPKTMTWKWWQTGYHIALIRAAGDRLVAASLDDGVLVQPHPAVMEDARSATPRAKH